MRDKLIMVRGAGDIASAVIHRLFRCGFRVIALETKEPSSIRRRVAFSEAVYDGESCVEDVRCILAADAAEAMRISENNPALLIDPDAASVSLLHPDVVADAILAKRNMGTNRAMAPITIGLGPGFYAGKDVDFVIETMRGHDLGRIIESGCAAPNTGIPGVIAGYGKERVIHSPADGILHLLSDIADLTEAGQVIARIETEFGAEEVKTEIGGVLRGILRDGYVVKKGLKLADVDPRREQRKNCFTISDKARCIAGSVLEAILYGLEK